MRTSLRAAGKVATQHMNPRADRVLKWGNTANTNTARPSVCKNSTRRIWRDEDDKVIRQCDIIEKVHLHFHTLSSPRKHANYKANVEIDIYEAISL